MPRHCFKIGISPIAWSNDDMHELGGDIPLETCLREASLAGYTGIELGHKFPREPAQLKSILDNYSLQLISGWHSTYFVSKNFEDEIKSFRKHLEFLKAMGCDIIICAESTDTRHSSLNAKPRGPGSMFSEDGWMRLSDGLNEAGKIAAEAGLKLVYHHHVGTGVERPEEIEKLMSLTDEKYVYLLADTGHLLYGGSDPLQIIKKYIYRIAHVHLKDIRKPVMERVITEKINFLNSVKQGIFTVPGDGFIDFAPIIDTLKSAGYNGWLVVEAEQDPKKANPYEYALKARKYIKEISGT